MVEKIKEIIFSHPELGYVSVKGFVEDAVRRRVEQFKTIERKNTPPQPLPPIKKGKFKGGRE
jgi:hypothetical protein